MEQKKKKKSSAGFVIIIIVALAIFAYSAYQLLNISSEYKAGDDEYDELASEFLAPVPSFERLTENEDDDKPSIALPANNVDFESLLELNEDVCAWLQVPDTKISYPVVQGEDNEEYLHKTFKGKKNKAGSVFMDVNNSRDFSDKNTVLYGHNMKSGSMFHDLVNFKEEEFFNAHRIFYIYLADGRTLGCEIFSAEIAEATAGYHQPSFETDEEFLDFANNLKELSLFPTDVEITAEDRIITLSTCSYEFNEARMVLHAKVIE